MKHLDFEDREDVYKRGMALFEAGKISLEELELGQRFRKEIEAGAICKVTVRLINDKVGHGLFADEDLPAGAYVGEYTGIVRTNEPRIEKMNNYNYEYPVPDSIGRHFVIDATNGCETRFINHSYKPTLTPHYAFFDGFYHAIFLAEKDIPKGTQLTYDYGNSYWYIRARPEPL